MEDRNTLAADCMVISCCCQSLIIQVVIFILLKLPYKLARRTKEYVKKKLRQRKKRAMKRTSPLKGRAQNEFSEYDERLIRIQLEDFHGGGLGRCEGCMEEVEKVLEEFSQRGEFAFGSFWGREGSGSTSECISIQESDFSTVKFELVEIVRSFRYSSNGLAKQ